MNFQVTWFWDSLTTHYTLEGLLILLVCSPLYFQETLNVEAHNTLCALVGLQLWSFQWMSHLVQFSDLSPLWVLWWILKTNVEKILSHLVHLDAFSLVWFLSGFFSSKFILRSSYHTLCTCVSSLLSFQETRCGIAHITECACRGPINILLVIWLRAAVVPFGAPKWFLSPASPLLNFEDWCWKTPVTFGALKCFLSSLVPFMFLFK